MVYPPPDCQKMQFGRYACMVLHSGLGKIRSYPLITTAFTSQNDVRIFQDKFLMRKRYLKSQVTMCDFIKEVYALCCAIRFRRKREWHVCR